jgi:GNAT superfamily N-acetyltransferase
VNYKPIALSEKHDTTRFASGEASIDIWLNSSARFSQLENMAQTFVIVDTNDHVIGYYALCSAAIHRNDLTKPLKKHGFPTMIPLILLARLGVDKMHQSKGIGAQLLADAFSRCFAVSANVAVHGVLVHALNDAVKAYYKAYGFLELPNIPNSIILPMRVLAAAKKGSANE